ncbi:class I adenylate-forming enzyme family protein [Agromyces neolithicus]|uniref:Synthetase n=1 Tax=Agromyces neolithicus TaxID=269420 RepID=A0ABP4YL24_9MICO
MLERLVGDGEALRLGGRRLSRAELRAAVQAEAARLGAATGPVFACDHDQVAVLVTVLAAIESGLPIVIADSEQPRPEIASVPEGAQLVVMTSGSSGTARPVARTLASWTSSFAPLAELIGARRDEALTVAVTGPLHVSMQLFAALHALWLGAVLVDERAHADIVHATPTVLARLVSTGIRPRRVVVAGAALPVEVRTAAGAAAIAVTEYYGAAELSFVAAVDHARDSAGTLRPFPGVEVQLRDGELWARSPYLAIGYSGSTGPLRTDEGGFATVGDRADATADGGLIVRGRGDAAINVSGTTVLAEDVEATLAALDGVSAVAVLAAPDPRHGHVPVAVLELEPGGEITRIIDDGRAGLAAPQRPRAWYVVDTLPRTTSGKVARGLLATALAAGALDADRVDRA